MPRASGAPQSHCLAKGNLLLRPWETSTRCRSRSVFARFLKQARATKRQCNRLVLKDATTPKDCASDVRSSVNCLTQSRWDEMLTCYIGDLCPQSLCQFQQFGRLNFGFRCAHQPMADKQRASHLKQAFSQNSAITWQHAWNMYIRYVLTCMISEINGVGCRSISFYLTCMAWSILTKSDRIECYLQFGRLCLKVLPPFGMFVLGGVIRYFILGCDSDSNRSNIPALWKIADLQKNILTYINWI